MSSQKLVLRDIPGLETKLKTVGDKNLLNNIHFALYGEEAKGRSARRHISSFSGFQFCENSAEYDKHCELLSKSLSIYSLLQLCDFFEYKYPNSASAHNLSSIFLQSFMAEFNVSNDEAEKNKYRSMSVKSGRTKSQISHYQNKHELRSKLLEKQNEIDLLQENIFSNQEEIIDLECEIEEMKKTAKSIEEIEVKQRELDRKQKFLKIGEARLKNKENSLSKYQEFLEKVESSLEECSSEEEVKSRKSVQSRSSYVREWTNKVNDHYDVNDEVESTRKNEIEGLTKSINNMLSRQTIGNQLMTFDGSSYLKWPIFYSQFKLSNETCSFSPKENVLRLNKSLTNDARKSVEMLLITAQNPDEILDILQKKYGRPEMIMEELLSEACKLPVVDSLESFMNFSNTIRNVAAVVEGDIEQIFDQRQLLASFVSKLPPHLLTQWGSYLIDKKIPCRKEKLRNFSDWIQQMSEVISRITFVSNVVNFPNPNETQNVSNVEDRKTSSSTGTTNKRCRICNQNQHPLENCSHFQKAQVKERWKIVQKCNACYCCLRQHQGKCKRRKVCGVNNCDRFHNSLLHKNTENLRTPEAITHLTHTNSNTLLKILPVKLKGPNGIMEIVALLDEGSTTTLLDSSVAKQLGLTGPISPLCCKWTGDIFRYENNSQIVQAEIAGKNATVFHELKNVRTMDHLDLPQQKYDLASLIQMYPFVQQAFSPNRVIEKPSLLIGQNNAHLIVSRQVIQPTPNAPILSKTHIGWTIHGTVGCPDKRRRKLKHPLYAAKRRMKSFMSW